jgi:hypothetical protein
MRRPLAALLIAALAAGAASAAVAVAQTQPDPTGGAGAAAAAAPPAADEGEEPPPATTPPASAIPSTPAPPVPEREIAAPPQVVAKPKPAAAEPKPGPKRALYNAAVLQVLDKVTTETLRFEAPLNKPIRYKGLIFTVHTCQVEPTGTRPPAEAHLQVISQPVPLPGRPSTPAREVFRGWMYVDAPGVHAFEHPVYDAWLIACKTAAPVNAPSR